MSVVDFLRRVLPPEGLYVSFSLTPDGRPRQQFHQDVDALAARVARLSDEGRNVYYAVGSFQDEAGGRKAANVHSLKALFLDVDCGPDKPYPSWREGLRAVGAFVADHKLPRPVIVSSGNGLHVYWILTEALPLPEWARYAAGLKALIPTVDGKAAFDPTVPADAARVLRPVGTINRKGDRPVRILLDAPAVPVESLSALLGAAPTPRVQRVSAPAKSALLAAMAVPSDFPPADPQAISQSCAQVRWAIDHPDKVTEPLWYALLGVASACRDPEETAKRWSAGHPGYSDDATLAKLQQWRERATGPATCARLETERPDGCTGCRFAGRIGTPARLGVQTAEAPPAEHAPDTQAHEVALPRPWRRTARGIVVTIDEVEVDVCRWDIYPVGYGRDDVLGYETVRYRWNRPHVGWQPLVFRQAFLADSARREFTQTCADQGIILATAKQTELFQVMLRAYMDELRQLRAMTNLYATMGWKEGDKFLLGETLYSRDAGGNVTSERVDAAGSSGRASDTPFTMAGTRDAWVQLTDIAGRAGMPIHMFALLVSFSAPLYTFSGLRGMTLNLYGPTGTGKTLAQTWQQSIWGDPARLHYSAKFTTNALFARIATYNNLPVTIDETTMMPAKEVGDFLYWVSQGRDKARLNRFAEERDAKTWATVVTTSSNRSMMSALAAGGLETDAQMARLLELTVDPHPLFARSTSAGKRMYDIISANYGHVGREFVAHLVTLGAVGLRATLAEHRTRFFAKYKCTFAGAERYWEQCIVMADLAGEIAAELQLIRFDPRTCIEHVLRQLGTTRANIAEAGIDAYDLIAEYMNAHGAATVTVFHTGTTAPQPDLNRLPRGEVRVRLDLYRPQPTAPFDRGLMLLDRTHFRRWLSTRGFDYRTLIADLTRDGALAPVRNDKAYLGKDTPIKLGQQYVLGVNLTHARFAGALSDAAAAAATASLAAVS